MPTCLLVCLSKVYAITSDFGHSLQRMIPAYDSDLAARSSGTGKTDNLED